MSDPLTVVAVLALALAGLTMLLSHVVPDHYDNARARPVASRLNDEG